MAAQFADDVDWIAAVHHLRITGDQHPDIMQPGHGPGQCGGDIAQAAGLDQVGDFRGDEQHFLSIRILTGSRCQRLGARDADRLCARCIDDARFADLLMSTLSLNI
ncbi:hypothetical protein D3C84_952210 [compost metagenome]